MSTQPYDHVFNPWVDDYAKARPPLRTPPDNLRELKGTCMACCLEYARDHLNNMVILADGGAVDAAVVSASGFVCAALNTIMEAVRDNEAMVPPAVCCSPMRARYQDPDDQFLYEQQMRAH